MKGLFIYISEEEYYHYGEIKHHIGEYILVALDTMEFKSALRLFHVDCLAHSDDVFLFETKEALDGWLTWLETPSEGTKPKLKIVNIKRDKT